MSTDAVNGYAPEYGEAVERAVCDLLGLRYTDGAHADAYTADGTPVQIKGTQRWVANGGDERARGRIHCWSESLLHLLHDGGMYLVAVYDPEAFDPIEDDPADADADALLDTWAWVEPTTIGDLAREKWHDAHRPGKGRRACIRWCDVPELAGNAVEADADPIERRAD